MRSYYRVFNLLAKTNMYKDKSQAKEYFWGYKIEFDNNGMIVLYPLSLLLIILCYVLI